MQTCCKHCKQVKFKGTMAHVIFDTETNYIIEKLCMKLFKTHASCYTLTNMYKVSN